MLGALTLTSVTQTGIYWIMSADAEIQKKSGYHHGDLRAQLVEATRQLVESKGPDHFSVAEACRVAGVSTAAPYRHFRDKDEMLMAVTMAGMQRQHDQMVEACEALPKGSLERIMAMGRVYVTFAMEEPGVFRLMFALTEDHEGDEAMTAEGQKKFGFVKQQVADCLGRNEIDADVQQRAFMLWSFVHGLSFLLIDNKVAKMGAPFDLEKMLWDVGRRVMAETVQ